MTFSIIQFSGSHRGVYTPFVGFEEDGGEGGLEGFGVGKPLI